MKKLKHDSHRHLALFQSFHKRGLSWDCCKYFFLLIVLKSFPPTFLEMLDPSIIILTYYFLNLENKVFKCKQQLL